MAEKIIGNNLLTIFSSGNMSISFAFAIFINPLPIIF